MTKPISPLRQRMIDDMTMRNLSPNTHETYVRAVAQFSAFHRRSPDKLGVEHLREYHLHLVSRGLMANSICVKMGALRFFYGTTLRRPDIAGQIPMPRRTDHLPTVLAREEVEHLLNAVADLKLRTALITIYSAGLRISEAIALTARDIDSARMVICVRQGKGRKDRYTVLSDQLLGILRDYWHRSGVTRGALLVSASRTSATSPRRMLSAPASSQVASPSAIRRPTDATPYIATIPSGLACR